MESVDGKLSVFSTSGKLYTYEKPDHVSIYPPGKDKPSMVIEASFMKGVNMRMFLAAGEQILVLLHESVTCVDLRTKRVRHLPVFVSAFPFKDAFIFVLLAEDTLQALTYLDLHTGETRSIDSIKVSASPLAILHHEASGAFYVHEKSGLLSVYLSERLFISADIGRGDLHLLADGSPMVIDATGISLYNSRLEKMSTIYATGRVSEHGPLFQPICGGEILVGTWDREKIGFKLLSVPHAPFIVLKDVSNQGSVFDFSVSPDLSSIFLMVENSGLYNRTAFFHRIFGIPKIFPVFTRNARDGQSSESFVFPLTATFFSTGELSLGRADGKSLLRYDNLERRVLFATMQSDVFASSEQGSNRVTITHLQDHTGRTENNLVVYDDHPEDIKLGLDIFKREEQIDDVHEKSANLAQARFALLQAFSMMRGFG